MSRIITPVTVATNNFEEWVQVTNAVAAAFTQTITVASNTTGDATAGNAALTGTFSANTLVAGDSLRGGSVSTPAVLTVTSNLSHIGALLTVSANVDIEAANVTISSNSTVDLIVAKGNSTTSSVTFGGNSAVYSSNVYISSTVLAIPTGNSTNRPVGAGVANGSTRFNTATSTLEVWNGTDWRSLVAGTNAVEANTILLKTGDSATGQIVIANLVANAIYAANATSNLVTIVGAGRVEGNLTSTGTANVGGSLNVIGNGNVVGAVTFSNTLTVTGQTNVSANVNVTGGANVGGNLQLGGAANVGSSLVVATTGSFGANLFIGGTANVGQVLNVVGNTSVGSILNVSGNTVLVGNTTMSGFANVGGTLRVTGAANVLSSFGVGGAATVGTTLNVFGATTLSSTLNVTSTVTGGAFSTGGSIGGASLSISGAATVGSTVSAGGFSTGGTASAGTFSGTTLSIGGSGSVAGTMSAGGFSTGGTVSAGYFYTGGTMQAGTFSGTSLSIGGGGAYIAGNATVTGTATIGGNISVSGSLLGSTLDVGNGSINGGSVFAMNDITYLKQIITSGWLGGIYNSPGDVWCRAVIASSYIITGDISSQSTGIASATSTEGLEYNGGVSFAVARDGGATIIANRVASSGDGIIYDVRRQGSSQGGLSLTGGTVSVSAATISHWGRFENDERIDIRKGTVLETTNKMIKWSVARYIDHRGQEALIDVPPTKAGSYVNHSYEYEYETIVNKEKIVEKKIHKVKAKVEDDLKDYLPKIKISDKTGSKAVAGVFMAWDDDYGHANDFFYAGGGTYVILMSPGETPENGDLVESSGDGGARIQKSGVYSNKTIAKITSGIPIEEYADGFKLYPCFIKSA